MTESYNLTAKVLLKTFSGTQEKIYCSPAPVLDCCSAQYLLLQSSTTSPGLLSSTIPVTAVQHQFWIAVQHNTCYCCPAPVLDCCSAQYLLLQSRATSGLLFSTIPVTAVQHQLWTAVQHNTSYCSPAPVLDCCSVQYL